MTNPTYSPAALRVSDLTQSGPTTFELIPNTKELEVLRKDLDLVGLRKVRLTGTVSPVGKRDWQLTAKLGATVVQPCVATLEDVQTRIDSDVVRTYVVEYSDPDDIDVEMPEDDTVEPLGTHIDPMVVLHEALALALPLYPRASDTTPVEVRVTEPGQTPMSDEQARPFAALAGLRDKMSDDGGT